MFAQTEINEAVEGLRRRKLIASWPRIAVFLILRETSSRNTDDILDLAGARGIALSRACAEEALKRLG
jgi:hypothetical protein